MKFSITNAFPALRRDLDWLIEQRRKAVAVALTRTAVDVRDAERAEIASAFDRPTPYTLNSLRLRPATEDKLVAEVFLKDDASGSGTPADKYLLPQIEGGKRSLKSFERQLQQIGAMPSGWHAVPGRFARLDAYGNVSYGQIIQILSQLRSTPTAGYTRAISMDPKKKRAAQRRAGGQYFALPKGRGRLLPGIYQARDTAWGRAAPRPVFIFVRSSTYRALFRFQEVAEAVAMSQFPKHFDNELQERIRRLSR
jgi:hypothetical protein